MQRSLILRFSLLALLPRTGPANRSLGYGKKLDVGVKLGRIEGPSRKKHGEASMRQIAGTSRKIKDATVGAINSGHQASQPISVDYTPALQTSDSYAHPVHYTQLYPVQQAYFPALPTFIQSQPSQLYAPAQVQQGRAPASRSPQPAQRVPAPQAQQGGTTQPCQRRQYTSLPAPPSHIFRQLLVGNKIRTEAPGPNFDPKVQNQNLRCEFHQGAPGHTLDNCWRLRDRIQEMINAEQISFNESSHDRQRLRSQRLPYLHAETNEMDMSRIRASKTTVRAFDGSRGEVNGEINLLIDLLAWEAMDSRCRCRSFIVAPETKVLSRRQAHHCQWRRRLCDLQGDSLPYVSIGEDQNLPFHSFDTISVIRDYGRSQSIPGRSYDWESSVEERLRPWNWTRGTCIGNPPTNRSGGARHRKHLHRFAAHYGRLFRSILVPPLSQFFPAPPQIMGGTFDSPITESDDFSSDAVEAFLALPDIYAIIEETYFGVHIRPAREDEELTNWTAVPLYGAMVINVLQSNPNHECNDSNSSETYLGKFLPTYFRERLDEDGHVPEIEESLHRLENHRLTSVEPTEEINIGTTEEPYTLKIETGLEPAQRARMIDFLIEYQEVIEQVDAGFLKVCNYSEWVANIVPVEKKNRKVRVYIDFRDLNKASPKDNFSLPHIDVLVDNIACHTQFSFMDGFFGYNQIQMAEEDKIKITFITLWGTFCYKKYKLRLNPAKCTFGVKSGKLLGFVVSEKGIKVDPDKVRVIMELPPPSTVHDVRSFLGRLNYIACFIANLIDKCQQLFHLLRKNAAVKWDDECQKAFDTVKAYLIQPPVLVPPSPDCPLNLYLTVRRQSIRCMLGQKDDSTHAERAIYYLSKKFTKGESNYPEIEKMCCALVWVMQRLWQYTLYHTIHLLSKMDPLKYLLGSPSSMRNIAKWRCQLTEYNIEFDIGAVLISPEGRHFPIAGKIDFPCTNNVAEYEACILGLQAAIDLKVKELEVFGDSMLIIF
ncbi:hypothetical protein CRG98_021393 [Punica granatum]|uniref:RNase H type-1 domain-containing protein n=1 Tax=Punica granatum TaxID=22663 RepID=A0A2I0JPK9_PUNGR|nr:hypothetical protein CRG98_021393 [Punica granatum]